MLTRQILRAYGTNEIAQLCVCVVILLRGTLGVPHAGSGLATVQIPDNAYPTAFTKGASDVARETMCSVIVE